MNVPNKFRMLREYPESTVSNVHLIHAVKQHKVHLLQAIARPEGLHKFVFVCFGCRRCTLLHPGAVQRMC